MTEAPIKKPRGLAALSPERRKEIASIGGKAVHAQGKGNRFREGSTEAAEAGRKGGEARQRNKLKGA